MKDLDLTPTLGAVRLPGVDQGAYDSVKEKMSASVRRRFDASLSLLRTGKHVYRGTVPADVKARRRAANKVARLSRRANR